MTSEAPDITVVIPVYNRGDLIHYTLRSVREASAGLKVETIIVDDGSTPPVAESLARLGETSVRLVRQENQGLLFARLRGLAEARGRHVLFLDSDDLVSSDKLRAQVEAMDMEEADLSYTDTAACVLEGAYEDLEIRDRACQPATTNAADFYITIQPAPHSPVFRTEYLRRLVEAPLFPPSPLYNPVAEIWFYHIAAPFAAKVIKVHGPLAIVGQHAGVRLTSHWERMGVASVAVMKAFALACPQGREQALVRSLVAEKAFASWRRLPRDFRSDFGAHLLEIWQELGRGRGVSRLGGRGFQLLAGVLGPVTAGRLLKQWQNGPYANCRTMGDDELQKWLDKLP